MEWETFQHISRLEETNGIITSFRICQREKCELKFDKKKEKQTNFHNFAQFYYRWHINF